MKKVFLYLYPIKEYTEMFLFSVDEKYDEWNVPRPLPILNECIQKRYRDKGYEVVFVLYPDKELYGINKSENDKIIYTDITFEENSGVDKNGKIKENFVPKYPSEELLINQLGKIDELIIGGYHFSDCVKKVAEYAQEINIKTIVDLDLTDLFYSLYRQEDYFDIEGYSPSKYKDYWIEQEAKYLEKPDLDILEESFKEIYGNSIYGFYNEGENKKKK